MMSTKAPKPAALIVILIWLVCFYPAVSFALKKGRGKIEGTVVNATSQASMDESIDIVFYQYLKDKQMGKGESQTDPQGNFEIKDLPTDKDYEYFITALYKGVEYRAGPLIFGEKSVISNIQIPVYQPTSDPSVVSVEMHHVLINVTKQAFQVEQYILFKNRGKKTYTGKRKIKNQKVVAEFVLPAGFKNLNLLSGLMSCCIISTEKGFVDTMPLKPGAREAAFSYTLPYSQDTYQFGIPVQFTTENISFLVNKTKGVKVVSEKLQNEGTVALEGKEYSIFSTKNIPPQTVIGAKFASLPGEQKNFNFILAGIIGVLAATGIVYPLVVKKSSLSNLKQRKVNVDEKRYLELLEKELLLDTVDLDAKLSREEISSGDYEKLRGEKKKKLIEIAKKLEELKRR